MDVEKDIKFMETSQGCKVMLSYRIENDVIKKMADNIESELFDRMARMRGHLRGRAEKLVIFDEAYCDPIFGSTAAGDAITRIMDKMQGVGNDAAEPAVLGADGKPIVEGETVYGLSDGKAWRVETIGFGSHCVLGESNDGTERDLRPEWLTHTPPDTQQIIDEQSHMLPRAYCWYVLKWSGEEVERADKTRCLIAMVADLLRRQRELDARTMGGAE